MPPGAVNTRSTGFLLVASEAEDAHGVVSLRSVDVYRDREEVRREYASEERLLARASIYAGTGLDANDALIDTIAERNPDDVLEVGCGPGRLAERLRDERGIRVTAVDTSERMVALTRARVLRPGGALIATTNSERHLGEMWRLVGLDGYPLPFNAENGAAILGRHFAHVDQQDVSGTVNFPDREAIRNYVASSIKGCHLVDQVPDSAGRLAATWRCCILTAS